MDASDNTKWTCPNCGTYNLDLYCGVCGIKKIEPKRDYSFRSFISKLFAEITEIESSKLYKTIIAFFFQPGKMAASYLEGRRKSYIHPVKLIIVMITIFFFFNPLAQSPEWIEENNQGDYWSLYTSEKLEDSVSYSVFIIDYTDKENIVKEVCLILSLFFLALFFKLILDGKRFYGEYLIISAYFYPFYLLIRIIGDNIVTFAFEISSPLSLLLMLILFIYILFTIKNNTNLKIPKIIFKSLLTIIFLFTVDLYSKKYIYSYFTELILKLKYWF